MAVGLASWSLRQSHELTAAPGGGADDPMSSRAAGSAALRPVGPSAGYFGSGSGEGMAAPV